MTFDNRPLLIECNRSGLVARSEHWDRAKSVLGLGFVLAASAAPVNLTGTAALTNLVQATLPGGALGPNGMLRISGRLAYTNSANAKTIDVKLGGVSLFGRGRTTSSSDSFRLTLMNRGSEASQIELSNWQQAGSELQGGSTVATATYAIDTSVDQVLAITGQLASIGELITLEAWFVELFPS